MVDRSWPHPSISSAFVQCEEAPMIFFFIALRCVHSAGRGLVHGFVQAATAASPFFVGWTILDIIFKHEIKMSRVEIAKRNLPRQGGRCDGRCDIAAGATGQRGPASSAARRPSARRCLFQDPQTGCAALQDCTD